MVNNVMVRVDERQDRRDDIALAKDLVARGDELALANVHLGTPCAVAVAPAGYSERPAVLEEIGVGYDGSPETEHALIVTRKLAATAACRGAGHDDAIDSGGEDE